MKSKKCNSKKCAELNCSCRQSLNHVKRIEGQLNTLKKYIEEGDRCEKVALLSTSIAKSFDSLRAKTLKSFFVNEILKNQKISIKEKEKIEKIFKLYKK